MGDGERRRSGGRHGRAAGNNRETTRAALLDAAQRLWAERGVQGASLHDVAKAAGLTKGAVYSNFTGKVDLLLALMERQTREPAAEAPGAGGLIRRLSEAEKAKAGPEAEPEAESEIERIRMLTLLLIEFWLYGMRDYSAGWRIADWYHAIRKDLAREFAARDELAEGPAPVSAEERARMVVAMDLGLVLQHLLDPARVPATSCAAGMRLMLDP